MISTPYTIDRTPASAPTAFSTALVRKRNIDAPQTPAMVGLPPVTSVPPITTTAIDISMYSTPMSSDAPPDTEANSSAVNAAITEDNTYAMHRVQCTST